MEMEMLFTIMMDNLLNSNTIGDKLRFNNSMNTFEFINKYFRYITCIHLGAQLELKQNLRSNSSFWKGPPCVIKDVIMDIALMSMVVFW